MRRTAIALGIGLGLLGSTVVTAPAQAANVVTTPLAATTTTARQVATFWLTDGAANLKNATPYAVQTVVHGERLSNPVVQDGKPGQVSPVTSPVSTTAKSPTTSGKVFFVGADGQPHWCTGTAVQSQYRNLVATAGHCVYDIQRSDTMFDKWVFVPGYSEGTTPWGLYVGKQVSAHYDFDAYTDYDRDFAFVNVYSGVVSSSDGVLTNKGRLGDNVGGQGFSWNQPIGSSRDVFGYPAGANPDGTKPYTGETLEGSTGPTFTMTLSDLPADQPIGVDSPFPGEGSLGSSWLERYSNDVGVGYLNGITISVSDTDGDNRYDTGVSPYFDAQTNEIYRAAANLWSGSILI
ncbi:trypsin-like serine peptidase [Nonomuraea sp. M3C6]|uniref:Trypsin-like serine peptidase n=1 Tax=Nonomuraea marmarensis TaxID=3351344 RepID=A0ABW7AI06_9ACTN